MTPRRAQRAARALPAEKGVQTSQPLDALSIGRCVEVWTDARYSGLPITRPGVVLSAQRRFRRAQAERPETLRQRFHAPYSAAEHPQRLAVHGLDLGDVPALRAQADHLVDTTNGGHP